MAEGIDPGGTIAVLAVVSLLVSAALTRPLVRATRTRPEKHHPTAGTMMIATNTRRI